MNYPMSVFPLQTPTYEDLRGLCRALWDWPDCQACEMQQPCNREDNCPWDRFESLGQFFDHYKSVTRAYVPEFLQGRPPALSTHDDVFELIKLLRNNVDTPMAELVERYYQGRGDRSVGLPATTDQKRALAVAARITMMVDISQQTFFQTTANVLLPSQVAWSQNLSPSECLVSAFVNHGPGNGVPLDDIEQGPRLAKTVSMLTAVRLEKIGGLRFQGTSNLTDHLRIDKQGGVVKVFHHTAFLKEYLRASRSGSADAAMAPQRMEIPRQLALEVLHSMQDVLFPSELKSQALLRTLVNNQGFDPDCLRFNASEYELDDERDVPYRWLGPRLIDLFEELENPSPRGLLERWLERKSRARHVMLATIIGVFVAILLGILSLGVAILQTWIAWKSWQDQSSN
ncbi:hypothetical protein F4778DRAFT_578610 [Xylariomycetidae sp. FL2044]|nr:hypothetical protein F4778DRAFT_578610 [Xylariomycetidae sp. FL2044]